jgi:uncharacterized repeat protein (TIGR02543 family)/uncharacterized delta-60 repeat protein
MIKKVLIFLVFLFFVSFYLGAQWAKTYGTRTDEDMGCIQQTTDGGYIVSGTTYYFGYGDFLILKLSSSGEIEWQKVYGGSGSDYFPRIQQTSDGGYVVAGYSYSFGTGYYDSDFLILKLSSSGEIEWQKVYGGSGSEVGPKIHQTSDGGYIVTGYTESFGAGEGDIWILKLDSSGEIEWQKVYGGNRRDSVREIQQTSDGGYIVAGATLSFGDGTNNVWVLKLSSSGEIEWQKVYGGRSRIIYGSGGIQETSDGGYIVGGETFRVGDPNFLILKLSSSGEIEWQKEYGGSGSDWIQEIQQASNGGYVVAGYSYSFGAGNTDAWILKLNSTGIIEWQKAYGGTSTDSVYSIQQRSNGGYILMGETRSFGAGATDFLILKITSKGLLGPSCPLITDTLASTFETQFSSSNSSAILIETNVVPMAIVMSSPEISASITILCEAPPYIFKISATDGGTTNPKPGEHVYEFCDDVSITAIPENRCRFIGWTGDVPSGHENDNPLAITMDSNKSVTANFIREYTLTIATGLGGTTNPSPGNYTYDSGTQVSITAIPDAGYRFSGWSGDFSGTTNPITITMNGDKLITANFIWQYTLTVTAGTGGTTDPVPGSYKYDTGTQASVKAIPNSGYRFGSWSGDASGTTNPVTVTMDSDKSITANFVRQYTLTIAAGTGGTTDPIPSTYIHDSGTQVSVKATPNSGYQFSGWSGSVSGTTSPITITMDADKSATANFTAIPKPPEEKKKGCFIATAAYGSPLHPYVKILQEFRDAYLMPSKFGRMLVGLYYKYSPSAADFIAKRKVLKVAVRVILLPFIAFSYSVLHFGPIITMIMPLFILAFWRKVRQI